MKNFLSNLWSRVAGSQRNDVEFDRRLTVGSPSGFTINWTLKLVSVLVLVLTIGIGNVWADYTITFKTSGSSSDGSTAQTTIANLISSGGDYVNSISAAKAFNAKNGFGVKLGSSSATGNVEMTMKSSGSYIGQIKASKLTVNAAYSDNGKTLKVTVTYTDGTTTEQTLSSLTASITGYDVSLTSTKTIQKIKIESVTASKGRVYCASIVVVAAGGVASHTLSSAVSPAGYGTVALSATSVAEGSTATATATANSGYVFSSWSISGTGASLSSTTDNPTTVTMGTANATVTAYFVTKTAASISFVNAGTPAPTTSGYYVGDSYTLPSTNNNSCNGKTFVGWSTVEVAETNTKPSSNFYEPGGSATLVASQTFYAVFANSSGASWSTATLGSLTGSDIFVIANGNYAIPNDEGTTSAPDATSITVAGGEITSTVTDNLKWNISGNSTDGYTFYPNGSTTTWLYCSTTADSKNNDNIRVGTGARKVWKPNNSGYLVTNDTYTARYLSMNGTTDFRSYVNTNNGVFVPTIYKYSANYSNYSTSCVAPSSFNVTYNANGDGAGNATGTTGSVPTDNTDYSSGATVTVSGQGTLAKEGYNFTGWNTAANGSGTSYEEGATFSITANTTLYAQWSIKKYTVTWHVGETTGTTSNVNHGTLFSAIASDAGQPAHGDGALELCGSTKFIGWVKASGAYTGDGKTVDWYDTYKVSASDEITSNTDYYAMYAEADGDASYQLVTSDLGSDWAGKYLIAYSSTIFADGRTGGESGIGASGASVNPTATYLSGTTVALSWGDTYYVTLEEISSGSNTYLLKTQDGYYNYRTANSNGIHTSNNRSTADDYPLTITYNSSSDIDIAAPAGAQFHYNTAGYFRFYKDAGQENIHLYKRVENLVNYRTGCSITCGRPSSPTSTSVTANSATIGWTGGGNGTLSRYEYAYWVDGDTEPTSGFTSAGTSTSANLTNLYAGVKYNWKVRKVCTGSDGESAWLKSDFTTTEVDLTFSVPTGVDAVDGQKSNVALPSANVPTGCGCWSFAGWTTASYATSSDAPAALFLPGAKARVKANAVLYAVYQKSAYRIISRLADIEEDEYYVFTLNDFGVDGAMTSNASGTYYTSSEEVSIKEDEIGKYIENPSSSAIWQFSGTTSAGLFMNIESRKYIDLSSTSSPVATTTTDNLTITVNDESEKQFDIRSNTTTTNYLQVYSDNQWGVDNDHDGYFSARIFKRAESSYSSAPSCPTYTVTFDKNGGTTHGTKYVTACEGYLSTLPSNPADNTLGCAEAFVGWSATELTGTGNDEPEDLFSDVAYSPQIKGNTTFYAVFASKVAGLSGKYTLDYSEETSLSSSSSWNYGSALAYTAKDGSSWTVKAYKNSGMQINKGKNSSIKIPNCPSGATITTIAITCSGSTNAVGFSASDYSGSGTISYLAEAESGTSQTLDLRGLEVTGGYIVPDGGTAVITKIVVNYAAYEDYMTYCTKAYNDATNDHKWSTSGNWIGGVVPAINERALINKQVVVDVATAKAKEVVLNQSSTNTGSMEISAGKALTVAETVQKTTDGSTLVATGENDIVFGSTLAAGTGALVAGGYTSGDNKATVNFAVKAKKDGSGHWINQYIGTPFNDQGAVLYNYYGTQLYAFHPTNDGNYDSGTGSANDAWWSRLAETDGMNPFVGYNILCSKAETPVLWMQGTLNAIDNQTINGSKLVYNGTSNTENLLANSWMASIHIEAFENGDFSNVEKTIYIFNAGSPEDYESAGAGAASATAAGQYIVLPIASAPWVSPTVTVIPAMQAFSVYATGANPSLTLDYNRLVYTPALTSVGVVPTRAPRRDKVAEDAPEVISLHVTAGSGYAANAYILGREDFADSFDDGWDGRFMEGDEAAPQLYAPTENGNLVINCVPNIEGTVVCFKRGSVDSEYTFTFSYEGEERWYLNDQKEQESTLISALDSYTFHSSADDMPARFVVSRTPIYKTPTGVENADGRNQKSDVRKIVIDDHVFIIRNGLMYDVTGALCK